MRTILTIVRSMVVGANQSPPFLWAEAINTAVYLKNRLPHKKFANKTTPYERLYGEKPFIAHLQPFGAKCFAHIPVEKRRPGSKLDARAKECIFIGYTESTKVYRLYDPESKRVFTSRDVKFYPVSPDTVDDTSGI